MHTTGSMLLISLGPIQDFIRSARRCQDLWFGSWLLSDLARAVGEAVAKMGAAVIFPAGLAASGAVGGQPGERPGVANLIFVTLPAGISPATVAAAAEKKLHEELTRITGEAFKKIANYPQAEGLFHRSVARKQIDELMEFMWVAVPYDNTRERYADTRKELYRRIAALKNTRQWQQPGWTNDAGAGVPKSSLDGERESVIDESAYDLKGGVTPRFRRRWFGLKGAERLCGVGLLKRLGHELGDSVFRGGKPAFHSASHIAAIPTIQQINAHPAVGAYLRTLAALGLDLSRFHVEKPGEYGGPPTLNGHDGALLFPSRMEDHFSENLIGDTGEPVDGKVKEAMKALRDLQEAVGLPAEPNPYYVYLLADGDNMGAAIDAITEAKGHHKLAAALNGFADGCRAIVGRHKGTLIFSGGDDVLALLPMHTALACARELAASFHAKMSDYKTTIGLSPSLSVGLAISHCREPMSEARGLAERAEKEAKAHPGKNALCVLVSKRSGGDLIVTDKWGDHAAPAASAAAQPLDRRLAHWIAVLEEGGLSTRTAYDLEEIAAHYGMLKPEEQHLRRDEIRALCTQILARKRKTGGDGMADNAHIQTILSLLDAAEQSDKELKNAPADRVRRMSEELQIARAFHRAQGASSQKGESS